ncbi:MAG: Fic family protein [bacterium]|nr:Fic family protein [bacterium]
MSGYSPLFQMTDEITHLVIDIAELVGIISVDVRFSPNPRLRRINRLRTIQASLAIEQNTLSLAQVSAVIAGKRVLGPPEDIREVQNAYEVYERMSQLDPFSLDDLLLAHSLMMRELLSDAGCFRSGNVGVFSDTGELIHTGTLAAYVPQVMRQLFAWLRESQLHPLIKGCVFHYEFEFIHPFSDGNGRLGRFWHSLIIRQWRPILAWLPVETMIREHQEEYYQALNSAGSSGESTDFTAFMLKLLRDLLRDIQAGQQENVGKNVGDGINQNARAVLNILRAKPQATAKEIAVLLNLSLRQAERLLAGLKERRLLARHGSPRRGWWEVL